MKVNNVLCLLSIIIVFCCIDVNSSDEMEIHNSTLKSLDSGDALLRQLLTNADVTKLLKKVYSSGILQKITEIGDINIIKLLNNTDFMSTSNKADIIKSVNMKNVLKVIKQLKLAGDLSKVLGYPKLSVECTAQIKEFIKPFMNSSFTPAEWVKLMQEPIVYCKYIFTLAMLGCIHLSLQLFQGSK